MKKTDKKLILVVEDDMATIDVYQIAFGVAGFRTEVLTWGEEAIKKIKEIQEGKAEKPALMLLDLILPDMNGFQVLGEVRKYEATKNLPVFILTNYTSQELAKMGYSLNAERYLTKTDYPPSQLIALIRERLNQSSK